MSESPGDLAVAFRSFGRRLDEALRPLRDDPELARSAASTADSSTVRLRALMADAAAQLRGVAPTADVAATGAAIANAIEAGPAAEWDAARLDRLRAIALDAGRVLRELDTAIDAAR